jgi:hypothetical protein
MKTFMKQLLSESSASARFVAVLQAYRAMALGFILKSILSVNLVAADTGRAFSTPDDAVTALARAVQSTNRADLLAIFGPAAEDLVNPDTVQATNEFANFAVTFNKAHRIVRHSDTRTDLEVGTNNWPFPVPLVRKNGQWFFDTTEGRQEIINRRIGCNELATLDAARAYVGAQREYASHDRDGDDVLEYAQSILSTPGNKDGLYWSPESDGEISPLGPLVAAAQSEGYMKSTGEKSGPKPFHGYYFKILTRQGKHAPGGRYDYVINGNMIGGFALVAWPAEYGESGIMTFIVNQQGRVYQKDLGPSTAKTAMGMKEYDPDKTWSLSAD